MPKTADTNKKPRVRRAKDPRQRENQLVSLAMDRAEEQLRDGTASSAVITHFLKLGSEEYKRKNEKLQEENALMRAKIEGMESIKRQEELYTRAIDAFKNYLGE